MEVIVQNRKLIEGRRKNNRQKEPVVWDILENVIKGHLLKLKCSFAQIRYQAFQN
jgi:hypothetical protein